MADQKMLSIVQKLLTCPVCLEEVRDPRSLQCQHTYCYKCLTQYIENKDSRDEIECPVCRHTCPIPNGNLEDLQVNFFFNHLKDAGREETGQADRVEKDTTPRCSNPECCESQATSWCDTCKYLCTKCEDQHRSVYFLRSHNMVPVEQAERQPCELPSCPKHQDQLLHLYCEECKLPICSVCYPLAHHQHKCIELHEKASTAKQELRNMIKKAEQYVKKSKLVSEKITEHATKVDGAGSTLIRQTESAIKHIHTELGVQREIIEADIYQARMEAKKMLQGEVDRQEMLQATLQSIVLCGNQLLQHGKPCDYLTSVPSLSKQLQDNNPDNFPCLLKDADLTEPEIKLNNIKPYTWMYDQLREKDRQLSSKTQDCEDMRKELVDLKSQLKKNDDKLREVYTKLPKHLMDWLSPPQPANGVMKIEGVDRITCTFPAGVQMEMHPHPGQPYSAATLDGLVPMAMGIEDTMKLLQKAFDAKLLVTVGSDDKLIWNAVDLQPYQPGIFGGVFRALSAGKEHAYLSLQILNQQLAAKGFQL